MDMPEDNSSNEDLTPEQLREKQRAEDLEAANDLPEPDKSLMLTLLAHTNSAFDEYKQSKIGAKENMHNNDPIKVCESHSMQKCECNFSGESCTARIMIFCVARVGKKEKKAKDDLDAINQSLSNKSTDPTAEELRSLATAEKDYCDLKELRFKRTKTFYVAGCGDKNGKVYCKEVDNADKEIEVREEIAGLPKTSVLPPKSKAKDGELHGCVNSYHLQVSPKDFEDKVAQLSSEIKSGKIKCIKDENRTCFRHISLTCDCGKDPTKQCNGRTECARMVQEENYLNGASTVSGEDMCGKCQSSCDTDSSNTSEEQDVKNETTIIVQTHLYDDDNTVQIYLKAPEVKQSADDAKLISATQGDDSKKYCNRKNTVVAELAVGSYSELSAKAIVGDNITPHHMPSNRYMEINFNLNPYTQEKEIKGNGKYTTAKGLCINVQHERHTMTYTYAGGQSDEDKGRYFNFLPAYAVKYDVMNLAGIYKNCGKYNKATETALIKFLVQSDSTFPELYKIIQSDWVECYFDKMLSEPKKGEK